MQKRIPFSPKSTSQLTVVETKDNMIDAIDNIIDHHYFQSKLQELIHNKQSHSNHTSVVGLLDDQYYKAQDDLIEQLSNVINDTVENKLRDVLTREFINIGDQIEAIKQDMFAFMTQQAKKSQQLKKQVFKLADEAKRRATTSQAMSTTSIINSNGYSGGIRFTRSGVTSSVQNIGVTSQPNSQNKSFHSQLMGLSKEIQKLKESIENGQSLKLMQDQFNQFKIQTKVSTQSLKQTVKKLTLDLATLSKAPSAPTLTPNIKQQIQSSVKRIITAQLKTYASYSQQILEIKNNIEQFEDKLISHDEKHNQYLTNQLKSVWLVLNDMKKTLDDVTENIGLNSSRDMI